MQRSVRLNLFDVAPPAPSSPDRLAALLAPWVARQLARGCRRLHLLAVNRRRLDSFDVLEPLTEDAAQSLAEEVVAATILDAEGLGVPSSYLIEAEAPLSKDDEESAPRATMASTTVRAVPGSPASEPGGTPRADPAFVLIEQLVRHTVVEHSAQLEALIAVNRQLGEAVVAAQKSREEGYKQREALLHEERRIMARELETELGALREIHAGEGAAEWTAAKAAALQLAMKMVETFGPALLGAALQRVLPGFNPASLPALESSAEGPSS